jgi:ABC-type nitrate/sulfonate/bicarbonate transport system ATPase subunit
MILVGHDVEEAICLRDTVLAMQRGLVAGVFMQQRADQSPTPQVITFQLTAPQLLHINHM